MVIYNGTGYKGESVDAEDIEPIIDELTDTDRIKVKILEDVKKMATVVHKGVFQTLHVAYNAISKWIEDSRYEIVGA